MEEMTYLRFLRSVDWSGHSTYGLVQRSHTVVLPSCLEAFADEHTNDILGSPDEEDRPWSEACLLQWFRADNYREDDQYGLVIPAMDIPNTNDSGNSNNTEGEPEEYPLTFGEVIGICPADQLRQKKAETVGNRDLDLQCDRRPKVVDMYSKGHLEHMVREKLLWWPRQEQAIGPDVASQHDELDEDPGASLSPPQRRVYQTFVGHIESVTT
ncbi:hypothetical protein E4U23_001534 [Claviceps purpurea]|nr:hypothetical protein E4U23_001534 [Claviceps purpurea]